MKIRSLLLAAAVLTAAGTSARADLLVDGNFSQVGNLNTPDVTSQFNNTFYTVNGGNSTAITGWTVTGISVDYKGSYWQGSGSNWSIDLDGTASTPDGNARGGIQQTFATVAGQTYTVGFDLSGNPDGPPQQKHVEIGAGGVFTTMQFDVLPSQTRDEMRWQHFTWSFVASGASTTLSFASLDDGQYGAALDNVSVVPGGTAGGPPVADAPEPASLTLLSLGGIGLGPDAPPPRRSPELNLPAKRRPIHGHRAGPRHPTRPGPIRFHPAASPGRQQVGEPEPVALDDLADPRPGTAGRTSGRRGRTCGTRPAPRTDRRRPAGRASRRASNARPTNAAASCRRVDARQHRPQAGGDHRAGQRRACRPASPRAGTAARCRCRPAAARGTPARPRGTGRRTRRRVTPAGAGRLDRLPASAPRRSSFGAGPGQRHRPQRQPGGGGLGLHQFAGGRRAWPPGRTPR